MDGGTATGAFADRGLFLPEQILFPVQCCGVCLHKLPRHSFNAGQKFAGVCGSLCYLRQIVFPFCGKLWGSEYIRQNTDKAVPVFGRDKLLPLALRKAALYQFFNDGGAGGGSAKPPAFRVRVGVPVPGAFHSRQKACFAVGLRRRCGMLRYFCGGVRKALSLGKLRQRHVCIFPVLRFGLIFQRRPVSALKLFPTLRKYGLSPCGEVCPGA